MKRLGFALLLAVLFVSPAYAYTSPGSPRGYVNDFAGVLSSDVVEELESVLSTVHSYSSNQIAVVTIPSMEGDYVENFAAKLFEEWGIGNREK
ncbi:MAG: hypothetical protein RIQ56_120, partial [Candidatus Parcubacteria bacterium]